MDNDRLQNSQGEACGCQNSEEPVMSKWPQIQVEITAEPGDRGTRDDTVSISDSFMDIRKHLNGTHGVKTILFSLSKEQC